MSRFQGPLATPLAAVSAALTASAHMLEKAAICLLFLGCLLSSLTCPAVMWSVFTHPAVGLPNGTA